MKRLVLLLLIGMFGLSACTQATQENLLQNLQNTAATAESETINETSNISKALYSYYLPPTIGRKTSTETSTILTSNNINILMNLDIINVISDSYYDSSESFKSMLAATQNLVSFDSIATNRKKVPITYRISVLPITDKLILLTLEGGYFMFTAITPMGLSSEILYTMIKIARTCIVDSPAVLLAYSTRESIDYKKETLDMFSQIAPESGTILDMISNGKPIDSTDDSPQ